MFTRHYNVNGVTCGLVIKLKFQVLFQMQTAITINIIHSKHAGSSQSDVKWLEKTLCLWRDGRRIGINGIIAILKRKRNRKFDFLSARSNFISHMNTKNGNFTRGSATRESTAFGVHSVK